MNNLYQRGDDGRSIPPTDYPAIPEAHEELFFTGSGWKKPATVHGWQWSTTFNSWRALVTFEAESSPIYTSVKPVPVAMPDPFIELPKGESYPDAEAAQLRPYDGRGTLFYRHFGRLYVVQYLAKGPHDANAYMREYPGSSLLAEFDEGPGAGWAVIVDALDTGLDDEIADPEQRGFLLQVLRSMGRPAPAGPGMPPGHPLLHRIAWTRRAR